MIKPIALPCVLCLAFAFQPSAAAQTIINQPQSITINNASTATFTIGAGNASTYQWQFNTANLSDVGNVSGSTTSALTLENVTSNQAGSYTVVVNNAVTSSPPAVLNIIPGTIVTFTVSGIIGGGPSNMTVQLFDHDKPATVQNFLHYVRSGAFSNMFFERCIPGFVLQGGDYATSNRTDTTPPIHGWDILSEFTLAANQFPPFPFQVACEYYHGPQIKNDFGTLAMPLGYGGFPNPVNPDSARNSFFFNLADNSGPPYYLDTTNNGPFTVFGRVIGQTNALQYFNTLVFGNGLDSNSVFFDNGTNLGYWGVPPFPNLPVNYTGSGGAASANLVYCDFSLSSSPPVDMTPPTVSITSPQPNALVTNGPNVVGTASDNLALADVICLLVPQMAADATFPNAGVTITNYADGTTNWSLTFSDQDYNPFYAGSLDDNGNVLPGTYLLSVQSQDGAGNLSAAATQQVIVTSVATNGDGVVSFLQGAPTNASPVGYPLQEGSNYVLEAAAATNWLFAGWNDGSQTVTNSIISFDMSDGMVLTATFVLKVQPFSISTAQLLASGTFHITFSGTPNTTYSLWTSTNLTNWFKIGASTEDLPGHYEVDDSTTTNSSHRFYQLRWP